MDANELLEVLEPQFDTYQRSTSARRNKSFVENQAAVVFEITREFGTKWQQNCEEKPLNDNNDDSEDEELYSCLSEVLVHFFDCAISVEYTASSKHSIDAIFELLAAVASHKSILAQEILDRVIECSQVVLERIRASSCEFIGIFVSFLIKNNQIVKEQKDELLDQASQALIPRITDKAQSVRLAFTHAAASFFGDFTNEHGEQLNGHYDDPELRQGLQWSLQHDPSVTTRVAALEALPVTPQTTDLVISRLRDLKPKVRSVAANILENVSVVQLDAEQCAAVIEAGSNSR